MTHPMDVIHPKDTCSLCDRMRFDTIWGYEQAYLSALRKGVDDQEKKAKLLEAYKRYGGNA